MARFDEMKIENGTFDKNIIELFSCNRNKNKIHLSNTKLAYLLEYLVFVTISMFYSHEKTF